MAEMERSPDRDPPGAKSPAQPRDSAAPADEAEVQDRYVARRVAEYRAETAEVNSQSSDGTTEAEAGATAGGFVLPIVLGLMVAALLLLVIHLTTQP